MSFSSTSDVIDPAAINRLARRAAAGLRPPRPRTMQPVRAGSRHRGERERSWWRPVDRLEVRATIEAAKQHEVATKQKGKRNGELGRTAITILELMEQMVCWADGTLEPSYSYIKARTRLSIDAIAQGLRRLSDVGFLKWIRRTQPVDDDGSGQYVQQIENAYRFEIPTSWSARVRARVAQLRDRSSRSLARSQEARDAARLRAARNAAAGLKRGIDWAESTIADPVLRAAVIADTKARYAIPPDGEIHSQGS